MTADSGLFALTGRTALVTGGSRGIGRMIAEGLLRAGAAVYITARKDAAGDSAARELSALGTCVSIPADVSTVSGIDALVGALSGRENAIDILVNNAGANWSAPFEDYPEQGWDKVLAVDLKAPFFLTQRLLPLLRRAPGEPPSKVVNIASIDGVSTSPLDTYAYSAAKAGLIHLTRSLALRLAAEGVIVNAIAPGAFPTDMNREARDHADDIAHLIPAGRVGERDDIAGAVVFLASRAGDYVLGETLVVDGGATHRR